MTINETAPRVNGTERPLTVVKLPEAKPAPSVPVEQRPIDKPKPATPRVPLWVRSGKAIRAIASHDGTRATVRHGSYLVGGARIVGRRTWDGRTAARYERGMRTAEAAGQTEHALEWEQRGAAFRAARHQRRMELLKAPQRLAKGSLVGAGVAMGGLLALGTVMAIANEDVTQVIAPTVAVIEFVNWMIVIGSVVWGPATMIAPLLGLVYLWSVGKRRQAAPQWALPVKQRGSDGEMVTPSIVVKALHDLRISELRKAIVNMEDGGAAMLGPITLAGCGVEVDVHLPSSISTNEIQAKRRKLAENLNRHEHELFVTIPPQPRTVRLWIADSGALDEPVPASPLVTDPDMTANYETGRAPWGLDLRGDAALLSLYQMHVLVTGLSNQGKTASLRSLALWQSLDPTVEFRIGDLKGIGDWDMFEGLATILIEGPTDDHVIAVTEMVEDVFEEMQRRLQAPKGTVFKPLICIVDEAQVAYGSGAVGVDKRPYGGAKATSRYFQAVKGIHDQGRAVDVTIWEGTQDPTDQNLPKRSREGNHIRAALALGTESQAKMALGETPVNKGAAPHKLRMGLDKGQLVVSGSGVKLPPGQVSINIRTHFIDDDDAKVIAERAKKRRSGVTTLAAVEAAEPADHLADIAEVIGHEPRVRTQEVLHRLEERNPREYREWTFQVLTQVLEDAGAAPYKSHGVATVSRDRVVEALEERARQAEIDEID